MKTSLAIITTVAAIALGFLGRSHETPMTESYKQMRIKALTKIRNEMVVLHARSRENEIRYIEDMISSIENGIEYERPEIDHELHISR